jgi:arylsulfatase A-like enzyme
MVDTTFTRALARNSAKPNFLVLWDEAAGLANLSSYSDGLVGYRTDNIDRIADEGMRFTDAYGEQCGAGGRIAFSTGQYPCRVSKEMLNRAHPTIATLLSQQQYATWHFGEGRNGGRSDTITNAMAFMIAACIARQPFYCWVSLIQPPNASHRATMTEHDAVVGELLDFLDERGLSDHTIVIYASGSGPQRTGCIDVGTTPFRVGPGWCGEGTYRVPLLMRWPGVVPAGEVSNEVVHHTDFLPTMLAITGDVDVRTRLRRAEAEFPDPIHVDGQNLFPYLRGDDSLGPRSSNIYFSITGEVMALRVGDWKCVFDHGRAERPWFRNLRGDPFERDELAAPIERWQEQDGLGVIGQAVLGDFGEVLNAFPPAQAITTESLHAALESLSAAAGAQH